MSQKQIKKPKHLINREISWLYFNHRVLQESTDPQVPLLERLRFLGIYSNNQDEFFRVRIAGLRRLAEMDSKLFLAHEKPELILKKLNKIISKYQIEFENSFKQIVEELKDEKIFLVRENQLDKEQIEFVYNFFQNKLIDSLTPLMISRSTEFPELTDARIYLAVRLSCSQKPKHKEFALIEIPSSDYSRFLVLPTSSEVSNIIMLDDVVRLCLPQIFQSLNYDTFDAYTIKITRDAEMENEYDFGESLVHKVSKGVKNRRLGNPVRFVHDAEMPDDMRKYILKGLNYKKDDTIIYGGRYHNFKDFMSFPSVGKSHLVYPKLTALKKQVIENYNSVIEATEAQDISLHYPYFDFSQYLQLLREAAIDPEVSTIKITLYRLASNSKVTRALINAARNGKSVTAVVEVRARFDEEHNIKWANLMQEAGIKVVFGVEGLKVHSKLTLIKKKNRKSIAAISTGNFHEGNASVYTDFTLLTANKKITSEVENVFEFIEMPFQPKRFTHLIVSPQEMRKKLHSLIQTEINNAKKGLPAYIHCKINHITDSEIIAKIYEAAKVGVEVKLVVRGMCSLCPPSTYEKNLEITGILDRFLEHSRILIFCNNTDVKYYLSSADWMTRNLDHRIEVAVPIYDTEIQKELRRVMDFALKDNLKSRIIDGKGENKFKKDTESIFRSQTELHNVYLNETHNSNKE